MKSREVVRIMESDMPVSVEILDRRGRVRRQYRIVQGGKRDPFRAQMVGITTIVAHDQGVHSQN